MWHYFILQPAVVVGHYQTFDMTHSWLPVPIAAVLFHAQSVVCLVHYEYTWVYGIWIHIILPQERYPRFWITAFYIASSIYRPSWSCFYWLCVFSALTHLCSPVAIVLYIYTARIQGLVLLLVWGVIQHKEWNGVWAQNKQEFSKKFLVIVHHPPILPSEVTWSLHFKTTNSARKIGS